MRNRIIPMKEPEELDSHERQNLIRNLGIKWVNGKIVKEINHKEAQ